MYKQLTFVLNQRQSRKCIGLAKAANICNGLVLLGTGIINNSFLNALGVKNKRREILTYLIKDEDEKSILDYFTKELQLLRRGHGFAFTSYAVGAEEVVKGEISVEKLSMEYKERTMFNKLTVIVDRGLAEDVMTIARNAGAKGGTILHGRGTGAEFTERLLGMEIEPEKELVVILMPSKFMKKAIEDLHEKLDLDTPGKGILYVEPVVSVVGLFNPNEGDE